MFHLSLWQQSEVRHLRSYEQHGAGVLAGRHAGSAAYALGSVHRLVGHIFRYRYCIGVGHSSCRHTDISACLYYLVEGAAVHHQVFHYGEGFGSPRLHPYLITVVELAHVQLARRHPVVVAVRPSVNIQTAHAADSLAAVVVETHGVRYLVVHQLLVQLVEHLQERTVGRDVVNLVGLEMSFGFGVLLPPYM